MKGPKSPEDRVAARYRDQMPGGIGDDRVPSDFDPPQLAKGIKVEMEHTDNKDIAREVAVDHLTEDPHYYDKLEQVEKAAAVQTVSSQMRTRGAGSVPVYAAFVYLSRTHHRGISPDCDGVQDLIQKLKDGDPKAARKCAAHLSSHPALRGFRGVVVPAPRSKGTSPPLMRFAEALVAQGVGTRAETAASRVAPVESSRMRRQRGLPGVTLDDHIQSIAVAGIDPNEDVLIIDDIVTTGTTIKAVAARFRQAGHRGKILGAAAGYYEPNASEAPACPINFVRKADAKEASMSAISRIAAKFQKKKEVPKADGKGTTTVYEYTEGQVQHRNREKAKRVEKLRGSIGKLRSQVKKDLKSKDEGTRLKALVVGLMDETYERIGNDSSAKDGHFGVTGWKVKHLTLSGGKATLKYVGKSGVSHDKVVTDAGLVSALKAAKEGKGANDSLTGSVGASDVNTYLKPFGITAKDMRGFHANSEMQSRLKAIRSKGGKLPSDKKERGEKLKKEFEQALKESAAAVGHEPATLKSQYLVPGLADKYLSKGEVSDSLSQSKKAAMPKIEVKSSAGGFLFLIRGRVVEYSDYGEEVNERGILGGVKMERLPFERAKHCSADVEDLRARVPSLKGLYMVTSSYVDEDHRGEGWGKALYDQAVQKAASQGCALVPEHCWHRGMTSPMAADGVWVSLKRRFFSVGDAVWGGPVPKAASGAQDDALEELWPGLSDWVFYNDPKGKAEAFRRYAGMDPTLKRAFDQAVSAAFTKAHGPSAVMYRRMKPGQSAAKMGGASLTTEHPMMGQVHAFEVKRGDVFLHPGVPDTPLNSRAFGHESEVILRLSAQPKHLGLVYDNGPVKGAAHRVASRWLGKIGSSPDPQGLKMIGDRVASVNPKGPQAGLLTARVAPRLTRHMHNLLLELQAAHPNPVHLGEGHRMLAVLGLVYPRRGRRGSILTPYGEVFEATPAKKYADQGNPLRQLECGEAEQYGDRFFLMDIKKDRFIHFTLRSRAVQIIQGGKLLMRPPYKKMGIDAVSGVSLVWGQHRPRVQTNHTRWDAGDELVGIVFQTATLPQYGYAEEIVWKQDVVLRNPQVVSFAKGVRLLSRAPVKLQDNDQILYAVPTYCSGLKDLTKQAGIGSPVTVPYLKAIIKAILADPTGWGSSSPTVRLLQRKIRRMSDPVMGEEPMTTVELVGWLGRAEVPAEELGLIQGVKTPRTPRKQERKLRTHYEALAAFESATGKGWQTRGLDLDSSEGSLDIHAWTRAAGSLKGHSAKLWASEVRKVRFGVGRGSEDASWESRGVMALVVGTGRKTSIPILRSYLTHELGHAFDEKTRGVDAYFKVYGIEPYVSAYAETNASEDFAECFRAFVEEPRRLKQRAPLKYADMAARLGKQVTATKDKGEKEKEEVERMNRKKPSKKPPRQDLRRNKMKVDDPDMAGGGVDQDSDLSLNFKKVAAIEAAGDSLLMSLVGACLPNERTAAAKQAKMPRVQYHATPWDRVPSILRKGLQLPRGSGDVSTFMHGVPSISTADKPEDASIYFPHGALLELRVKPGFKYLKRSPRKMKRGESLVQAVDRWAGEVQAKGAVGFWMEGWQSTVGNQTYDPRALEVVRVVNPDDAPKGRDLASTKQAARPIRLPTREIKALSKKLALQLRQRGLPRPGQVVAQEYLYITNVLGNEIDVEILLTGSPRRHPDPFNNELLHGGFLKRRGEGPLMRVFVNPYLRSFEQRPTRIIEDELYRLLAHELTHAADVWSGKGSAGDLSGSMEDLKRHHHNHPAEVRALMRDVVTQVGDSVQEFMGYGMGFNMAVREALKDSKWPDIEPYLTPRNKQIILKGVHTHLKAQDAAVRVGGWGSATATRIAARVAPDADKKEGDYWQTRNGWGVWPPGAKQPTSATDEPAAKRMAEGNRKSEEEEPDPEAAAEQEKADRGKAREKQRAKHERQLDDFSKVTKDLPRDADRLIRDLDEKGAAALAEAYTAHMSQLREGRFTADGLRAEAFKAANKALKQDLKGLGDRSLEAQAEMLAEYVFARQVVSDPSLVGGVPINDSTKSADQLQSRAEDAFRQFLKAGTELMDVAARKLEDQLSNLDPESDEFIELDAIKSGMVLAASVQGRQLPGADEVSKSFQVLSQALAAQGDHSLLLRGGSEIYGPEGRSRVREALDSLPDADLVEVVASKDTAYGPIGAALLDEGEDNLMGGEQRAFARDLLKMLAVNDMTTMQGFLNSLGGGGDEPEKGAPTTKPEDLAERVRAEKGNDRTLKDAVDKLAGCIAKATTQAELEKCKGGADSLQVTDMCATYAAAEKVTGKAPDKLNPQVARVRHVCETGEVDVLDQKVEAHNDGRKVGPGGKGKGKKS
jgi:DNA topoisomerase IB